MFRRVTFLVQIYIGWHFITFYGLKNLDPSLFLSVYFMWLTSFLWEMLYQDSLNIRFTVQVYTMRYNELNTSRRFETKNKQKYKRRKKGMWMSHICKWYRNEWWKLFVKFSLYLSFQSQIVDLYFESQIKQSTAPIWCRSVLTGLYWHAQLWIAQSMNQPSMHSFLTSINLMSQWYCTAQTIVS